MENSRTSPNIDEFTGYLVNFREFPTERSESETEGVIGFTKILTYWEDFGELVKTNSTETD